MQNLPVNGRNFIDFALLTPGVTRDVRTGDISFAGQRGTLNSLVVDGADNNNTFFGQTAGRTGSGRAPYQFSQDAVKEFQVNSNSFSAEYGRAGGAVINVVTKSGTNELHGSAFEFYRDKALNANNAINELNNRPKSPYHYNQFGGTLGGPIRREPRLLLRQLRRPAQHAAERRLPEPAGEHADRPGDAGRDRAAAAARRRAGSASSIRTSSCQDRPRAERGQPPRRSATTIRTSPARASRTAAPQNALEHTGASLVKTRTFNASWTEHRQRDAVQRAQVPVRARQGAGRGEQRQPRSASSSRAGTTVLTIGRNNFSPRETTIKRWQVADTADLAAAASTS